MACNIDDRNTYQEMHAGCCTYTGTEFKMPGLQ